MSKNIHGLRDLTNEAVVEVIRRKYLLEADTNPHMYHPIDVQRCRSEDWQIERFLLEKGTQDEALKALIKALQWKKSFGVHERSDNYFPKEFPLIFGHQKISVDREGVICVWSASALYRKIPEFIDLVKQYAAFHFEFVDRKAGNKSFIAVSDAQGISYSHMDMTMANFTTELMGYYPQVLKIGCTVDLPWLMVSIWKVMRSFLSKTTRDKVALIKREELTNYLNIDADEIPISLGGSREPVYYLNQNMLPLHECKHLDFTDKQIDNFYKVYNFDKI